MTLIGELLLSRVNEDDRLSQKKLQMGVQNEVSLTNLFQLRTLDRSVPCQVEIADIKGTEYFNHCGSISNRQMSDSYASVLDEFL